jgi:hypothetical protein
VARLRGSFQFATSRFQVRPELLGRTFELTRDGRLVRIRLPDAAAEHPLGSDLGADREEVWGPFAGRTASENPASLRRFRIDVEFDSDYSYQAYELGEKGPAFHAYSQAWEAAAQVAAEVIAWARVERDQWWLGPSGHVPSRIGRSGLFDLDAKKRFGVGIEEAMRLQGVLGSQVLEAGDMERLVEHVAAGVSPPDAETLLADALYFAFEDETPHPARGLLLAGIASELKIKTTLREKCDPDVSPLVEFVLERGRIAELLGGPLRGAVGRSLLDEDKQLYDDVHRLFRLRNDFVHHGKQPDDDEARSAIRAADRLFDWLTAI